jgi:hypothetical protein
MKNFNAADRVNFFTGQAAREDHRGIELIFDVVAFRRLRYVRQSGIRYSDALTTAL